MKKLMIHFAFILLALISHPVFGQNVGDVAPNFTVATASDGNFTLSDHLGKVVMVFFFGNGCPFCEESGPYVQGIYDLHMSNPDFIAIGLDTWDNSSDAVSVAEFASFTGITFPLGIDANSVKTAYSYNYDRLMVIDKEGIIRTKNNTQAINDIDATKAAIEMYLDVSTDVQNISEQVRKVSVYPLPARDVVHAEIYLELSSEVKFVISDISGKIKKRTRLDLEAGAQRVEININDLEQGMYFYTVYFGDKSESGKLLIQ